MPPARRTRARELTFPSVPRDELSTPRKAKRSGDIYERYEKLRKPSLQVDRADRVRELLIQIDEAHSEIRRILKLP